ncbi:MULTISPECIES: SDR family NAD(P)-dependent oxidoreductase [unclassified Marinobacterium]|uniref:SDR family NAD(P)-dependent oxidoreductase n=1 Tax=unclassified Marinobacterium TaxID=2644139 RepID=UPI0015688AD6|nr:MULTISPECIES: SDR family NAD(P)-dependent oxidoreductase [unclassified Marinobacterium]NRP53436.1 C-factor [Marinobacterium sp. xm-v-242]NRP77686.1 C-factor [Marinobacterium sp. xm-m-383]
MADLLIIGSGGIGQAFAEQSAVRHSETRVLQTTRSSAGDEPLVLDLTDASTFQPCIDQLKALEFNPARIIFSQGLLHNETQRPEKSLREMDLDWMTQVMQVNALGPMAFLAKLMRLIPRQSELQIAFLSARVGSISDNQLGGWYGYRASKAALNMLIKTLSIELARTHPKVQLLALHPGTTDTELSRPFQARVPEGKLFTTTFAASALLDVMESARGGHSGQFLAWDGSSIPW